MISKIPSVHYTPALINGDTGSIISDISLSVSGDDSTVASDGLSEARSIESTTQEASKSNKEVESALSIMAKGFQLV